MAGALESRGLVGRCCHVVAYAAESTSLTQCVSGAATSYQVQSKVSAVSNLKFPGSARRSAAVTASIRMCSSAGCDMAIGRSPLMFKAWNVQMVSAIQILGFNGNVQ